MSQKYNLFTRSLAPLKIGDNVLVQDHCNKRRWNGTGIIVKRKGRKYTIRMNGSGRVITRNRRVLRTLKSPPKPIVEDWCPSPSLSSADTSSNRVGDTPENPDEDNSNVATPETPDEDDLNAATPKTLPLMMKRLLPHNKPGLSE